MATPTPSKTSTRGAIAPYAIIIAIFSISQLPGVKTWLSAVGSVSFAWPGLDIVDAAGKPVAATTFKLDHLKATGTLLLLAGVVTAAVYGSGRPWRSPPLRRPWSS
ncbi:MAG TPA: hypothetical protein VNA11_13145 [Pseudonocardia sp.]|nr:hypothetical protein [Pseudonocardia sp.]